MSHQSIELLAPAGSLQKSTYAFAYGADAVYAGVPLFSLRARENEFNLNELKKAIFDAHKINKKFYLTSNIFARNNKIKPFINHLNQWINLNPDALIISDPGLLSIVKEKYPEIPIHLSVQANCMNWRSVKFWQKIGVNRIILSRELKIDEIKEIKQKVPDMELESFVHGSICIAFSGRCLLSYYMSTRDANQGVCDNSCRYEYNIYKTEKKNVEDDVFFIEDLRNNNLLYQVNEDKHGTYFMNAKDLCLIEYLKEIIEAGVNSFKIEGRTKSLYYLIMVIRCYRQAIEDLKKDKKFDKNLLIELAKIANRGYHYGFLLKKPDKDSQNYDNSVSRYYTQKFAGIIIENKKYDNKKFISVEVRNKLSVGDECEVIFPHNLDKKEKIKFKINNIYNKLKEKLNSVHGGTGIYDIEVEFEAPPYSILSLIIF